MKVYRKQFLQGMRNGICLFLFLFSVNVEAQEASPRIVVNINSDWKFLKSQTVTKSAVWESIQLPHTWNQNDVMDDEPGYYRGVGWYRKMFALPVALKDKSISLHVEGANQETEVYINGTKAGEHIGGYTGFTVALTKHLKQNGANELLVKVNNRHNRNIPPLTADFTFYGGIYRDVFLVATNKIHFNADAGSQGVYLTTTLVNADSAKVRCKSIIANETNIQHRVKVFTIVKDENGKAVTFKKTEVTLSPNEIKTVLQDLPPLTKPALWSPENPTCYSVETIILDVNGRELDQVNNKLGFRWFSFDASNGFFLNGEPYKLIGASRHQDYQGLGNAVPDRLALQDLVLLKNMGANFLRVAHYPQDPSVLQACDSLGLLASVEIPIVNEITETDSFYNNSRQMLVEMIRQDFNHPSVIMWCYMNEVLLRPPFNDNKERQETYFNNIKTLAQELENLARKEDPFRYTMMANHGNLAQYRDVGLLEIPMVVGWNLYSGWYGGSLEDFPKFLDNFHRSFPHKPFLVTEYGADADPRIRSLQPVRFDKSVEYTTHFHQNYYREIMKRPYVAGAMVWNLADFNSETRAETMPHINNKGLLQWNRTPKDPYFFYQAVLSKKPYVKILGEAQERLGQMDTITSTCLHPLQIAANLDSITLRLNGSEPLALNVANGLAETSLPLKLGTNAIVAEGKSNGVTYRDTVLLSPHLPTTCLALNTGTHNLNVLLGSRRYFKDEKGTWWQPNQPYKQGSWGAVGGQPFKLANNNRLPYGTDKNITGTNNDPIYQTQQVSLQQYRLDVPPGNYKVWLHFAELVGGMVSDIPYNLQNGGRKETAKPRIFNVKVNGRLFLSRFNIAGQHGLATAVIKETTVLVGEEKSIIIDFEALEGEPVLNAVQIKLINPKHTK